MHPIIGRCPVCEHTLEVTRLYCRHCDTALEGHFSLGRFYQLSPEQLRFVETFVSCQGKLNRVQDELSLSYPTVRNRLHDVIRALGYEVDEEEEAPLTAGMRQTVLAALASGEITAEEAARRLRGVGA
ncbi:MAG: DUF2089 domain-containing protein [Anaerolineales bacterium]|nr:MAG: DUF2089 domain-containing protein [Anaerolineales bacterium]